MMSLPQHTIYRFRSIESTYSVFKYIQSRYLHIQVTIDYGNVKPFLIHSHFKSTVVHYYYY